ncbi:MAG: hypothetical protein ACK5UP_13520, partial [Bacteroidota bacterium]
EKFPLKLIYRFPEPVSFDSKEITIPDFDTLKVQLDGKIRDTEALFADPVKHDLYLVSKREDSVRLFQVTYPFTKDTMVAKQVAILPFHKIVAAHITHSGQELLMKDYDRVYYWQKRKGLAISEWLQSQPEILAYDRERQGEAICWANDGNGYYTLSEAVRGEMGKLLYYKRK